MNRVEVTFILMGWLAGAATAWSTEIASSPLEARSGPPGATLFKTIAPSESGITAINQYSDPRMWTELYQEFTTGAIGTGVAIGDFDGDGLPDIFLVSKTGENHLYKNLGHLHFLDVTAKAGVAGPTDAWKQGAVFVDVNNDGKLDLFVCRRGAPNLLYINQGNGSFSEEAQARGLALVDGSANAAFEDYDRDGALDLFLQTNLLDAEAHPTGERNHLFHNDGHGVFTEVTDQAGISTRRAQGHSATWWDFNEDGWPDLYVANDFNEPDCLYRNNGDGTFTDVIAQVTHHVPQSSMGADVGDLCHDGHLDLIVAEMAERSRRDDQRTVAPMRVRPVTGANASMPLQTMRNAVFLNTGMGVFQDAAFLTGLGATDWTWSVRMEDLDDDGWTDVFFTNGMVREFRSADLLEKMANVESISERNQLMVASPPLPQRHFAFRNRGELRFEDVSSAWGLDQTGISFGAAFGDLDRDGDLDLVFANYQAAYTLCRNDSNTGHRVLIELHGTVSNRFGIGATVRLKTKQGWQKCRLILNRGYLSSSEPLVHFGLGASEQIDELIVEWPSGNTQRFTQLEADRRYTITEPSTRPALPPARVANQISAKTLFTNATDKYNLSTGQSSSDGVGEFQLSTTRRGLEHEGPSASVFDGDGAGESIFVGGVRGVSAKLLSPTEGGGYLAFGAGALESAGESGPTLFIDVDGDGHDDALTSAETSSRYKPRLIINDGSGHFVRDASPSLPVFSGSVTVFAAADFDHDGALDVFVGGTDGGESAFVSGTSALWRNHGGKFENVTDAVVPELKTIGKVNAALWSDVDGDGWADLIVAADWGGIYYFHNEKGVRLVDESARVGFQSAGAGWWTSIASADFNGDGRPDFVVGNAGLNTRYSASPASPLVLLSGLINARGASKSLLAESSPEHYPLASRPAMVTAFPELGKKFPTFESYSGATIETLFSAEKLAHAQRVSADQLASGVLLSLADGTYQFRPLPRMAQLGPIYGLQALDLDGDGHSDIVSVGNSFQFSLDRDELDNAIGNILRGDGRGNFSVVPPSESGWIVPGDAKALVMTDFNADGRPDFFVSRRGDSSLAFEHGAATRFPISLRLHGRKGNPHGIGARVLLVSSSGLREFAEVRAGSGYFSQSTPKLFFALPQDEAYELKIRWPDGHETSVRAAHSAARIDIAE